MFSALSAVFDSKEEKEFKRIVETIANNTCPDNLKIDSKLFDQDEGHFASTSIINKRVKMVAKALTTNQNLKSLDISSIGVGDNRFKVEGAKALGEALAVNKTLTNLNLDNCGLTDKEIKALVSGLAKNTTLQCLSVNSGRGVIGLDDDDKASDNIKNEGYNDLVNLIDINKSSLEELTTATMFLKKADVDINEGGGKIEEGTPGACIFQFRTTNNEACNTLGNLLLNKKLNNKSLEKLTIFIWWQRNGDAGIKAVNATTKVLAQGLANNKTLKSLNFGNCDGNANVKVEFFRALAFNNTLRTLRLGLDKMESSQALSKALIENSTLTRFILQSDDLEKEGAEFLEQVVANNVGLTSFKIHKSPIGDEGAKALAKGLIANKTLKELILVGSKIGNEGAKALIQALNTNKTIQVIDLKDNPIAPELLKILETRLARIETLHEDIVSPPHNLHITAPTSPRSPRTPSYQHNDNLGLSVSFTIDSQEIKREKELGQGGFGIVYKGTWRQFDVAVKQLLVNNLSSEATEEFAKEAQVMARLRAPNIVQFYGYSINPYCIVMEYMPNGSLFSVLHSQQPLEWTIRAKIAIDMACGLAFLHHENIIHRDIKSLNVLLNKHMEAKLTDFGLSRVKSETQSTSTAKSSVGTVAWMAPELSFGDEGCTKASDMYSFGITLWELAARQIPFRKVEKPALIPIRVNQGMRDEIPADCPQKLTTLIQACWDTEPQKRPDADTVVSYLKSEQTHFASFLPSYQSRLASNYQNNLNSAVNSNYQNNLNSTVNNSFQGNLNSNNSNTGSYNSMPINSVAPPPVPPKPMSQKIAKMN